MRKFPTPQLIVSKCLGFEACRWNGMTIPDLFIKKLEPFVEYRTICPEVEIGLGIPRDPIRVVKKGNTLSLRQPATGRDVTDSMIKFSNGFLSSITEVDGFILKSRSPSCGIKDVKYYLGTEKSMAVEKGPGFFGRAVFEHFSDIVIEDEGRLSNFRIREHFLTRIFSLAHWREVEKVMSISRLVNFHTDNKLLLMAYSQKELRLLGKIVANHDKKPIKDVVADYGHHFKQAIAKTSRNTSNINVIMHTLGYFSEGLIKNEKRHFIGILDKYRQGAVPLSSPLSIIQSWISRFDQKYLARQTFFEPYPEELCEITDSGKGRDY
ncbi:MAG TPA: DUF1722 domain-containing protein [candidate division Zixibacteria bacterium]|jgi:uncharacterized protein YbgA (DUF1722 family)/uncharacterized protein YbbK (DUF523 family)|nr:DUF1722 domain-containing protein [candidate division Zixibacteria bacterium]HBZ00551.1 DUF1722 domain-containing protein [candidate division Zixibacteria bacterium]